MKIFANRYRKWHKKFAWFPVFLTDTKEWIWLEQYQIYREPIDGDLMYERSRRIEKGIVKP